MLEVYEDVGRPELAEDADVGRSSPGKSDPLFCVRSLAILACTTRQVTRQVKSPCGCACLIGNERGSKEMRDQLPLSWFVSSYLKQTDRTSTYVAK